MLKKLLGCGYFPMELPPLFQTRSFADCLVDSANNLPAGLTKKKPTWTAPVNHNLARSGGLRRRLQIPNPLSFYRLAREFDESKKEMKKAWNKSPYSLTKPWHSKHNERALTPPRMKRSLENAARRIGKRYVLTTDVSQFYSSIYTHSIAWAFHTKKIAKQKKGDFTYLGNRLDGELSAGQEGQTKGVPIGPDTSLALAEIILGCVDKDIAKEFPAVQGMRFIDDMYFFTDRYSTAQRLLNFLETHLAKYELQLNLKKTAIAEVPCPLDNEFIGELRLRQPRADGKSWAAWIDYFDCAFSLAQRFPFDNIMRYAIASLGRTQIGAHPKVWNVAQKLLWQSLAIDPGVIKFVLDVVLRNADDTQPADLEVARAALNHLIRNSAPSGHSSEVAWALWALLVLKCQPSSKATDAILGMEDDVVAVAARAAAEHGVWSTDFQSPVWTDWLVEGCLHDEHWLYAYEAYQNGWCKVKTKATIIKGETGEFTKFLGSHGVTFLDLTAMQNLPGGRANFSGY